MSVRPLRRPCPRAVGEIPAWLKLAGAEKTSPAEDIAALHQATESIVPILLLVDMLDRSPEETLPNSLRHQIADALDEDGIDSER